MALHQQEGATPIRDDERPLTPAERVLLPTPTDREYFDQVVSSTVEDHGAAVESVIQVAMQKYRARHTAYVEYLKPTRTRPDGGEPRNRRQSSAWREAEAAWNGAFEALAALLGQIYPDRQNGSPRKALNEARALVEQRVGPLCTGYRVNLGAPLEHHPSEVCPVHADAE